MTVNSTSPLPVGNALKVFMAPTADAVQWRLMRNTTGVFAGPTDPLSQVVYTGDQATYCVDVLGLLNGTTYSYCLYSFDGSNWTASAVFAGTPAAIYADQTVDVLTTLRDRLRDGMAVEVIRKTLVPQSGVVPVLNASPDYDNTPWPVVSVHVQSDAPAERGIGEFIGTDDFDPATNLIKEGEGWLAGWSLTVAGWSKNSDERLALRRAIKRLLLANLPVFDAMGMLQVTFSMSDADFANGEYPAPVFQTLCSFSCLAPAYVTDEVGVLEDITVDGEAVFPTA